MKQNYFHICIVAGIAIVVFMLGAGCGKSTIVAPQTAPTTCVDGHASVSDSICNMGGTRPAWEHHVHEQYDSGLLVSKTIKFDTGINFIVTVSPQKTISYQNDQFTLVSSTGSLLHYTNHNLPNGDYTDIFYYPVNDSFVITSVVYSTLPGISTTDIDTLFAYW